MPRAETFKKIAFLAPRPGMDQRAFTAYWRGTHGPTVAHAPNYAAYRRRYAQNHRIGDGPVGGPFPHPGIAIFHLPGDGNNEAAFSRSATYRDCIRIDELNFIDMDRTLSMTAREDVIRPGAGPVKAIILARRCDGMDRADFDSCLHDISSDALINARGFTDHLAGWTLNRIVEGSFQLPGARPAAATIDAIQELWFSSEQDLQQAFAAPAYRDRIAPALDALFAPDRLSSFRAEEIVFFDAGRPTPQAGPAPPIPPPARMAQNRT